MDALAISIHTLNVPNLVHCKLMLQVVAHTLKCILGSAVDIAADIVFSLGSFLLLQGLCSPGMGIRSGSEPASCESGSQNPQTLTSNAAHQVSLSSVAQNWILLIGYFAFDLHASQLCPRLSSRTEAAIMTPRQQLCPLLSYLLHCVLRVCLWLVPIDAVAVP